MLQDEERMKRAVNVVPSHRELNAMMARNPAEEELFNRLDAELPWPQIPLGTLGCLGYRIANLISVANCRHELWWPDAIVGIFSHECFVSTMPNVFQGHSTPFSVALIVLKSYTFARVFLSPVHARPSALH